MTTTVCDLLNKIITADTRWSCGSQHELQLSDGNYYLAYCDTTGFDKISVVGKAALITAGHGGLIAEWKKWWAGDADPQKKPPTDLNGDNLVNIAIIDLEANQVIFDAGVKQVLYCTITDEIKAFTSGSGASHAASSLLIDGCARSAVSFASLHDYCTGNNVSFACYQTDKNNLNVQINDYNVIVEGIIQKGKVMNLNTSKPSNNGCDIADHPLAEEIRSRFTSGQAVASAPVPGIGNFKWTNDTDDKFKNAMKRVHELRKN